MSRSASRREFLQNSSLLTAGLFAAGAARDASAQPQTHSQHTTPPSGAVPAHEGHGQHGYLPVEVPDVPKLSWTMDGDVKVFELVCEPVKREFLPGWTFDLWGFNGTCPGPTIEVVEGDRVRIHVMNKLPELTSMHWHGLELPIGMDGVQGLTQDPILPGEMFTYEFDLIQNGTFFYHSHMAMQEMLGMLGLFIIHPKEPHEPAIDRDFALMFQEWSILPNNTVPNTMSMEPNWVTINGKAGPATTPLIVQRGERVRIRMVNLSMTHHPIHLHGNTFYVTGTEAGRIPETAWFPGNTVILGVAQARDVEFDTKYPGDWMLHCHLPHHMMNHMVSMVGPLAHGSGMPAGLGMDAGMGILQRGHALSDELGPSLGRGMGFAAMRETPVMNHHAIAGAQPPEHEGHDKSGPSKHEGHQKVEPSQQGGHKKAVPSQHEGHQMTQPAQGQHPPGHGGGAVQDAGSVPGYPQDMFMPNDELYQKPETFGMRPTWSGGVEGMMTVVRVLEPDLYDQVRQLQKAAAQQTNEHGPHHEQPKSE